MSRRDQGSGSNHNQNNENKQAGKTKAFIYLIVIAFILGSVIASGVTFVLLKGGYIALKNPTPSPTPTVTPSTDPTPIPSATPSSVQPSQTPTGSPSISPQTTESPQLGKESPREGASKNSELPGYFPDKGFKAPPSDLSQFKQANSLIKDMVISGNNYVNFATGKILIRNQLYPTIFLLRGNTDEQRVGFQLDGSQKGLLLQIGQQDLSSGTTNLTYLVKILVDGKLLWAGECSYGQSNQIISLPLGISGAKSLVVEYAITKQGNFPSYNLPPLYFTKAELLNE